MTEAGTAGLDRPAVQLGQPLHQREANTKAAIGPPRHALDLRKNLEDPDQAIGSDADPVVLDRQRQRVAVDDTRQVDLTAGVAIFRGVRQQVREDLRQPQMIRVEQDRFGRQMQRQVLVLGLQRRTGRFHSGIHHVGHHQRFQLEMQLALRDARDVEQVIEQQRHVRRLALDDHLRALELRGRDLRRGNQPGRRTDRCQRVAQLVRQRRDEFILAAILLAQLVIELRQAQLVELLGGHINGHAVEMGRGAVGGVVGAAERADPLDFAGLRMHGAVDDVVRCAAADRHADCLTCRLAVLGVHPRVKIVDADAVRGRKEEVLFDAVVPLEIIERQVAIPETDARQASRIVEARAIHRQRAVGNCAARDIDTLHQDADHRAVAFGERLIDKIDVALFARRVGRGRHDVLRGRGRVRLAGPVDLIEDRHVTLDRNFRHRIGDRASDDRSIADQPQIAGIGHLEDMLGAA